LETCLARFQGKLQALFLVFGIIKPMKKTITISLFIAVSLFFSGCESKNTSEMLVAPPNGEATNTEEITESIITPQETTLTSSIDIEAIDSVFNQNFSLALEDAKKILGENTKFCFAKVSFLGGVVTTQGEMDFFFENSERIADYYWLVSINSTTAENQKKRYLAAQRDWGDLTCTTLTSPSSFAKAYDGFAKAGKLDTVTTLPAARTDMTLVDKVWKIELFNTSGEAILSETEGATPAATTSTTPAPAT